MTSKEPRKTRSRYPEESKKTAALCGRTDAVMKIVRGAIAYPHSNDRWDVGHMMAELASDLREIEAEDAKFKRAIYPPHVANGNDEDQAAWGRCIQRARLAVFETACLVSAAQANEYGWNAEVLINLTKCLSSAQTSAGDDWRKLKPPSQVTGSMTPVELEKRAILVSVAMLRNTPAQRQELYAEAERVFGWDRAKSKQIVHDHATQKLNHPRYLDLVRWWQRDLEKKLKDAKEQGRDISTGDLLADPYQAVEGRS
jgi:hypothetical protein